MHKPSSTVKE